MTGDVLDYDAVSAFNPADYPFRVLVTPEGADSGAPVGVIWIPTPWADSTISGLIITLAAGGGLFLMARTRGELIRMRESVELLLSTAGEA